MYLVTAEEMQTMDRRTIEAVGVPGRVLMENAARGAVEIFLEAFPDALHRNIGVLAGRGNNGGDGFVMARYLAHRGAQVTVFLLADAQALQGDAWANFALLSTCGVKTHSLPNPDAFHDAMAALDRQNLWIDAILGTGLKSAVRGYFKEAIDYLNGTGKPILSVDLPSGLDADTGQPLGTCVQASVTATFGFAKTGHVLFPGATLSGPVSVVDIGIPKAVSDNPPPGQRLLTAENVSGIIIDRPSDTHKGRTGHLLVVAGAPGKSGAAALCATAAMRAGAGLVTLGVPRSIQPILMGKTTEVMTAGLPETDQGILSEASAQAILDLAGDGKKCLALGPGMGTASETGRLVGRLVAEASVPVVMDADALNLAAEAMDMLAAARAPVILTPHPGEMARLTGLSVPAIQADRIGCARAFAMKWGVYLVLKGAATVVADPDGQVAVNPTGNVGMASGGMGDVLTGIIAGLIVQGHALAAACRIGVFVHGAAADLAARDIGPVGYLAGDVMERIPAVWRLLSKSKAPSPPGRSAFVRPVPRPGVPFWE